MSTDFDAAKEQAISDLATAAEAVAPNGIVKGMLNILGVAYSFEIEYQEAIEDGLTVKQAQIVAGVGAGVALFTALTLDAALTAAVEAAITAAPPTAPLAIGLYSQGIFVNAAAATSAGNGTADAISHILQIDWWDEITDLLNWDSGSGTPISGQCYFGDDSVVSGTDNFTLDPDYFVDSNSSSGSGGTGQLIAGDEPDYLGGPAVSRGDFLVGTAGDDTIYGYLSNDVMVGGAGNDQISGGGQSGDVGFGGDGNDVISGVAEGYGGAGADWVYATRIADGGSGLNHLYISGAGGRVFGGNDGNNVTVQGGATDANVTTGSGADNITVNASGATIDAGGGANYIEINTDNATITGGSGVDTIRFRYTTSSSVVTIDAGDGNNIINTHGLNGNMTVNAGSGNDVISASAGHSEIQAGAGNNSINLNGTSANVSAGNGNDTYNINARNISITDIGGTNTFNIQKDAQTLNISGGDNTITSRGPGYSGDAFDGTQVGGDNHITTGSGNDTISLRYYSSPGSYADNSFNVGDGNNTVLIRGAYSKSVITAGSGNDTLTGSAYADDTITGGGGVDVLSGGGGSDTFIFNNGDSGTGGSADTINSFNTGCKVDLSSMGGLTFVGLLPFSGLGVGEVGYSVSGSNKTVLIDHNGDGLVDSEIKLVGLPPSLGSGN